MPLRPIAWLARLARATAVTGLLAAGVPVGLWAVPALRRVPSVSADRNDGGTVIADRVVRQGLDRYGYVCQVRTRVWEAPVPALLDALRRDPGMADLAPIQSWRVQLTHYGIDHAYLPRGVTMSEAGTICSVPYSLVAAVLAAPAGAWGALAAWRRLRRWTAA